MVQIRERQMEDRVLLAFVREAARALQGTGTALIVNDRADVAIAGEAHGVHLKSDGPPAAHVRRLAPGALIGRSVHSEQEAREAEARGGCDYLMFGTVFRSFSKPTDHPIAGTAELGRVSAAVSLPVLAIGGVTPSRAGEITRAGAAGAAAISYFSDHPDIAVAVEALRASLTLSGGSV
jgi:thiamine-phosphate diphosphorylase